MRHNNGYPKALIEIADKQEAFGRPPPPIVSWLSGGLKGDILARDAAWRRQLEQWERENPIKAADYLELKQQYICEEERLEAMKWKDATDAYVYERLVKAGAPRECVDAIRDPQQDTSALKRTRDWMVEPDRWCLTLLGGHGCGKTSAAAWAVHQLMTRRSFKPRWVRCAARSTAPLFGMEAELHKFQCRTADVLVLDDIAAGAHEQESKVWLNWLDDVLDARWGNRKRTLITSNLLPEELAGFLGPRIMDRLREGVVFACGEPSLRGKPPQQPMREPGEDG